MAAQPPTLRRATFDDYPQIIALEESQNLRGRTYDEWSRLWIANPCYRELGRQWPIGWVLEAPGGKVVGSVGNVPLRYHFRGETVLAAAGRAWAVQPEYRGFALALMAEFFGQSDCRLFLNTTVNGLAREPFTAFGSAPVPAGQWDSAAYWITHYRGFAKSALRLKSFPAPGACAAPAAFALYVKDALTRRRLPKAAPSFRIERLDRFDQRFDSFWWKLRAGSSKLLAQRDRQTLEWHFGAALKQSRLRILAVPSADAFAGYAILQRKDHPEIGLTRLRLVDLQVDGENPDVVLALLNGAMRECEREGVHVLEQVGCKLAKTALVDEYAPYRRDLAAWCYYYQAAGSDAFVEAIADPAAWDPSSFDGDSSL